MQDLNTVRHVRHGQNQLIIMRRIDNGSAEEDRIQGSEEKEFRKS